MVRNAASQGGGSTYNYQFYFNHTFLVGYPDWVQGSHVDDLYSVFGDAFMDVYRRLFLRTDWEDRDYTTSNTWMDYLTNFVYTGSGILYIVHSDKHMPYM